MQGIQDVVQGGARVEELRVDVPVYALDFVRASRRRLVYCHLGRMQAPTRAAAFGRCWLLAAIFTCMVPAICGANPLPETGAPPAGLPCRVLVGI